MNIIQGDCLEVMKTMESNIIDLCVLDPPYNLDSISKRFGKKDAKPAKYGKDGAFQRASAGFMGKKWDVLPSVEIWKEMLRVMKPGAFAFILCTPRQDSLAEEIKRLDEAGFVTGFTSLYWCYAQGFCKAHNIGKAYDKSPFKAKRIELKHFLTNAIKKSGKTQKQINEECGFTACSYTRMSYRNDDGWGEALPSIEKWFVMKKVLSFNNSFDELIKENERISLGKHTSGIGTAFGDSGWESGSEEVEDTKGQSKLEGSYGGFQPKPAVEVIIVVMKPMEEKTFLAQALANGKGITWLGDCRIPYQSIDDAEGAVVGFNDDNEKSDVYKLGHKEIRQGEIKSEYDVLKNRKSKEDHGVSFTLSTPDKKGTCVPPNPGGRFMANLLVEDDVIDAKTNSQGHWSKTKTTGYGEYGGGKSEYKGVGRKDKGSSGTISRYFSLDAWANKFLPFLPKTKIEKEPNNPATNPLYRKNNEYKLPEKGQKSQGNVPFTSSKNEINDKGRFPANVICEDEVLNEQQLPFLYSPKASKKEKNKGLNDIEPKQMDPSRKAGNPGGDNPRNRGVNPVKNTNPCIKPIKLLCYLITLGSREGDLVLDCFAGSGSTGLACEKLNRNFIGIEMNEEYVKIARKRTL